MRSSASRARSTRAITVAVAAALCHYAAAVRPIADGAPPALPIEGFLSQDGGQNVGFDGGGGDVWGGGPALALGGGGGLGVDALRADAVQVEPRVGLDKFGGAPGGGGGAGSDAASTSSVAHNVSTEESQQSSGEAEVLGAPGEAIARETPAEDEHMQMALEPDGVWHRFSRTNRHSWRYGEPLVWYHGNVDTSFFTLYVTGRLLEWTMFSIVLLAFFAVHSWSRPTKLQPMTMSIGLVVFWGLLAALSCTIIYFVRGADMGTQCITGYLLELIFSIENIFATTIIFNMWEVPKAQTRVAMIFVALYQLKFEVVGFMGLGQIVHQLSWLSYIAGIWLCICAYHVYHADFTVEPLGDESDGIEERSGWTFARALQNVAGDRLIMGYDCEGSFVVERNGKYAATLLVVVSAIVVIVDLVQSLDTVFTKIQVIQDPVANVLSSALVCVALPDMYLCNRALFRNFYHLKYGMSFVLLFLGVDLLITKYYVVPALVSSITIGGSMIISIFISLWLGSPRARRSSSDSMTADARDAEHAVDRPPADGGRRLKA